MARSKIPTTIDWMDVPSAEAPDFAGMRVGVQRTRRGRFETCPYHVAREGETEGSFALVGYVVGDGYVDAVLAFCCPHVVGGAGVLATDVEPPAHLVL